ncbi:hypothetical protein RJ640_028675 [Escallonia rubra]|uniref:Phytocyanin domain-containing protein n=1 Tax=Escallonia rubra TaxID=112253 RepID=A0AA88UDK9_9ASTE|nr:hypothetical protein RJ640_028675 [Escallonia rubra]
MASVRVSFVVAILAAIATSTLATDIVVGDQGWTPGLDYQAWAQGKEFHVGDRLGTVLSYLILWHTILSNLDSDSIDSLSEPVYAYVNGTTRTFVAIQSSTAFFLYPTGVYNVYQVDEIAFDQCAPPPGTPPLATGNDVVALTAPGIMFFICGIDQYCKAGNQKLAITILPKALGSPSSNTTQFSAAGSARFDYFAWMVAACGAFLMILI